MERENKCLDIVKKGIFLNNEDLSPERINKYFGLSDKDTKEIEKILKDIKENPNPSLFPDFIFSNGFIEHFQITSSIENKKGSSQEKQNNIDNKEIKKKKEIAEKQNNIPDIHHSSFINMKTNNSNMVRHEYEYLKKSFEKNWNHHIDSLDKYTGEKNIGIFMVEYNDMVISMKENFFENWKEGMLCGDIINQKQEFFPYRISRDKELLNYIYKYKEKIKYIIFIYNEIDFEIIKIDSIPYLLNLLPWNFYFFPLSIQKNISCYPLLKNYLNLH